MASRKPRSSKTNKPVTPNLNSEQLQNTGPHLKVYIREWLAGAAVAVVLEESGRYIRALNSS